MSVAKANAKVCPSKTVYATKEAAMDSAFALFRKRGDRVFPYRCKACKKWHIGHRPVRKGRRR